MTAQHSSASFQFMCQSDINIPRILAVRLNPKHWRKRTHSGKVRCFPRNPELRGETSPSDDFIAFRI